MFILGRTNTNRISTSKMDIFKTILFVSKPRERKLLNNKRDTHIIINNKYHDTLELLVYFIKYDYFFYFKRNYTNKRAE